MPAHVSRYSPTCRGPTGKSLREMSRPIRRTVRKSHANCRPRDPLDRFRPGRARRWDLGRPTPGPAGHGPAFSPFNARIAFWRELGPQGRICGPRPSCWRQCWVCPRRAKTTAKNTSVFGHVIVGRPRLRRPQARSLRDPAGRSDNDRNCTGRAGLADRPQDIEARHPGISMFEDTSRTASLGDGLQGAGPSKPRRRPSCRGAGGDAEQACRGCFSVVNRRTPFNRRVGLVHGCVNKGNLREWG